VRAPSAVVGRWKPTQAGPVIFGMTRVLVAACLMLPVAQAQEAGAGSFSTIALLTTGPDGSSADGPSRMPALSADGSIAAFQTEAADFGASRQDVAVRDVVTGQTRLVSRGIGDVAANGSSGSCALSADGRFLAFVSDASNLVAGDDNGAHDVFVWDRESDSLSIVSVTSTGAVGAGDSYAPAISADGRYVAFVSTASNLVSGDTGGHADIFVRDRAAGTTVRVSGARVGGSADGASGAPAISSDGAYVAFSSSASNLIDGDTNGQPDVFRVSRSGAGMARVSVSSTGAQGTLGSFAPSLDATGRRVAFESLAANLVTGDTNGARDVFVRDVTSGVTRRVSVPTAGSQAEAESREARICGDGSKVAFSSVAGNLVPSDLNGASDVFVWEWATGYITRISNARTGGAASGSSAAPAFCGSGGSLAFHSEADDIAAGDDNGVADVFVANFGPRVYRRVAGRDRYTTAVEASKRGFPFGAPAVVIATGANWPDALGGSALAGVVGGPLLLTETSRLTPTVKAEIRRLGASRAYILGGTASVSANTEREVRAVVGAVSRLGGSDRYVAAQRIADEVVRLQGASFDGTVLVATGGNYPDALAGSPVAAAEGRPIVLVDPVKRTYRLPSGTRRAVILGGKASVATSVESSLRTRLGSGAVIRLGGRDRYEAAAGIARWSIADAGLEWNGLTMATGEKFPDALSGGVMAARVRSVVLLTRSSQISPATRTALQTNAGIIGRLHVVGGPASVSEGVLAAAKTAMGD